MPTVSHIGVSRRIADRKERKRLREIVQELRPPDGGFIVRTACEGLTKKEMQDDMKFLLKLWGGIAKKQEAMSAPALLHDDMDVILRIIRDLFTHRRPRSRHRFSARIVSAIKEFVATFLPRRSESREIPRRDRSRSSTTTTLNRRSPKRSIVASISNQAGISSSTTLKP